MRKIEEFQETKKLMEEYKGLDNKVNEIEHQKTVSANRTRLSIERMQEEMNLSFEDVEMNIDRTSVEEQYNERIEKIKEEQKDRETEFDKQIEDTKNEKKYFRTDSHLRTITMEIEAMKKEVQREEIDLKRKDVELEEFYQEEQHENPLKWQEIYKEQDEIRNNIKEINKAIEEYSSFLNELKSIELTPEEYKKMFELENKKQETSKEKNNDEKNDEPEITDNEDRTQIEEEQTEMKEERENTSTTGEVVGEGYIGEGFKSLEEQFEEITGKKLGETDEYEVVYDGATDDQGIEDNVYTPFKIVRVKTEPQQVPESVKTEPIETEPVQPEPIKPEPIQPEPIKPEPVKAETVKAEPAKPETVKPEPANTEPEKPESRPIALKDIGLKISIGQNGVVISRQGLNDIKLNISDVNKEDNEIEYEEVKDFFENSLGKKLTLSEKQMDKVDGFLMIALNEMAANGLIPEEQYVDIVEKYLKAITYEGDKPIESDLKDIIEYDRTNLDYLKPSNIIKRIIHKDAYDNIRGFSRISEEMGIATVKEDEPGVIRKFISKMAKKIPLLSSKKTKALDEGKKEYSDDEKALLESMEKYRSGKIAYKDTVTASIDKTTGQKARDYMKNLKAKTSIVKRAEAEERTHKNKERANAFATHVSITEDKRGKFKETMYNREAAEESNKPHVEGTVKEAEPYNPLANETENEGRENE